MRKVFVVAAREFLERVRTRGFILSALLTPVLLIVVLATGAFNEPDGEAGDPLAEIQEEGTSLVAFVDEAALIERMPPGVPASSFRAFEDEDAAAAALAAGEIEAYYVIMAEYRETGEIRRVSEELPAGSPNNALFEWLLQANLTPGASPPELARLQNPLQSAALQVETIRESAGAEATNGSGLNFMPFLVAMLVMIPLFTSGSYLLASLAEEKSNRIMEILLVSLRPSTLLSGKLLGLGALTLVQYVIWVTLGGAAFLVLGRDFSSFSNAINLTVGEIGLIFLYALGGYALYATVMAGLGALSPDMEATRSWVFVITLPMLIPIYLWVMLVNAPAGGLAVTLSLIPFSAPIAMLMRISTTTVPAWQVVTSLILLGLTSVVMVWLMSRLFRVQTLLSGESFSPGRFWRVLRSA